MSKKKEPSATSVKRKGRNPNAIEIAETKNEEEKEKAVARLVLDPVSLSTTLIKGQYPKETHVNLNAMIDELKDQAERINSGDMTRPETMLIAQAHTLDALFAEMLSRARSNMDQYPDAMNKYMNLALRAQSQCRATLEGLAEIKNPRPYIQNNRAEYQQVNNGFTPSRAINDITPHARENPESTNELLEDKRNEQQWLDTGAPKTAGGDDKKLEAVEAKHRT